MVGFRFFPLVFSFIISASAFGGSLPQDRAMKISHAAFDKLVRDGSADLLLHFESATLPAIPESLAKEEKGRIVYDTLRKHATATQRSMRRILDSRGTEYRSFYLENMVQVPKATYALIQELTAVPELKSVDINPTIRALEEPIRLPAYRLDDERPGPIQENLKAVGADRVWNERGVTGQNIVVAGADTGYFWKHPALQRQYRGSTGILAIHDFNWHDAIHSRVSTEETRCAPNSREPCDDSSHGTHTMGTMVGNERNIVRIGVAPGAKWIGCRNMDHGTGTAATYIECFEFFLAPYASDSDAQADGKPEMAPHVINNSWACPASEGCKGDEFVSSVRALRAAGIMVVVAAGNDGSGCGTVGDPPGSYSGELISTAAYDHRDGEIAYFSSRGPSAWNGGLGPNLSAPGVQVNSSVPSDGSPGHSYYETMSGTSMASPHIAGVVALLWSARPNLVGKVDQTIELLQRTARPKTSTQNCGSYPGSHIPNAVFGYGQVDAYQAIMQSGK
ncbi:MAG TPA: S8 family serine peptidase [Bdellovibrionota bacterium]|jgi:subtilisin family serine protease